MGAWAGASLLSALIVSGCCQRREGLETMRMKQWLLARVLAGVLASVAFDQAGRAAGLDWKFYGGVSSPNGQSWCFYDASAVAREPGGLVRVPAKCLPQTDMDDVDDQQDFHGAIARDVAQKRRRHYLPPYALAEAMERGQAADITRLEVIADVANIKPRVRISYELDCAKHLARELSLYVDVNGKVRSVDKPTEWKPISPRENSVRLFRILCRPR
jgi:hypothetical protein